MHRRTAREKSGKEVQMNRNDYQKRNAKITGSLSHHRKAANPGVEMLTKEADKQVQAKCSLIAEALAKEAIKGNASSTRLLVDLAEGADWVKNTEAVERVLSIVEAWKKEPKCDDQPGKMPAGVLTGDPSPEVECAIYVN